MIRFPTLVPAVFVRRDNRFRAVVTIEREAVPVHIPNSGRLAELLVPGSQCFVAPAERSESRRTWGTLHLVEHRGGLVCINAHFANELFADAWRRGTLGDPFTGYRTLTREITTGDSRIDFLLSVRSLGARGLRSIKVRNPPTCSHAALRRAARRRVPGPQPHGYCDEGSALERNPHERLWVEVKCVTQVGDPARDIDDGLARFPDAPTERGARHLRELAARVREGDRAAAVFIVQRGDAVGFTPHVSMDPPFAEALSNARAVGVGVHCFGCHVSRRGMSIDRRLPLFLE